VAPRAFSTGSKGHSEQFEPFRNPRPDAHGIFTNPSDEDETIEILQGGGQRLQGPFINHVIPIFQSALADDIEKQETPLPDINQVSKADAKGTDGAPPEITSLCSIFLKFCIARSQPSAFAPGAAGPLT
jgi:hypothetical protein